MPVLTVLAGPNGAGKSYFSGFFLEKGWITNQPVNIDALESYVDQSRIPNDPMRYKRCLEEQIDKIFNELCHEAIQNKRDFSFECNLRRDQLGCVGFFDDARYAINLIYIYLDNIEISKSRVQIRISEGGHIVGDDSILENFNQGLKNLDDSVSDYHWNHVYIVDNSKEIKGKGEVLTLLLEIENERIIQVSDSFVTEHRKRLLPKICKLIEKKDIL